MDKHIETIARGVCIIDGKVLLCRAKGGATTYLPGGHIEFGETAKVALEREVKEELGVDSSAGEFLGVVENAFTQKGRQHAEINLVYRLTLAPGVKPEELKSQEGWIEFEWCPLGALDEANLLPAAIKPMCER